MESMKNNDLITEINSEGFTIINNVYSETEINHIISIIESTNTDKATFKKTDYLFAIRQFHKEIPGTLNFIFNEKIKEIINKTFGNNYFITKSIYFDKPELSNWFVAYHQDLTISVDKKVSIEGYKNWTIKDNQYAVIPPLDILKNNFTIRIHLDKTTSENGALKVVNQSHAKGIYRSNNIDFNVETETICEVEKGGIMIMKPLLLHASNKTTNLQKRRVIHIEFSNRILPNEIEWSEKTIYN